MLTFEWDRSQAKLFTEPGALQRAITRAVSKAGGDAIRKMRTEGGKRVRNRKRFKAARVRRATPLRFPRGSRTLDQLEWRMDVSGREVPLVDFPNPRQTRKGASVGVNTGKRTLVKGAFLATMKSGHTGIFRREGKARLPIKELFSTRVSDVFRDADMVPALFTKAQTVFSATFTRLLPLELAKAGR